MARTAPAKRQQSRTRCPVSATIAIVAGRKLNAWELGGAERTTRILGGRAEAEHPHTHSLECRAFGDGPVWVCPDGEWRSPIGQYDELDWPPADLDAVTVPDRVFDRLSRRDVREVREASGERRSGRWIVCIGVWPMSDALTARLREIAAPVEVEVYPQPGQWWAA